MDLSKAWTVQWICFFQISSPNPSYSLKVAIFCEEQFEKINSLTWNSNLEPLEAQSALDSARPWKQRFKMWYLIFMVAANCMSQFISADIHLTWIWMDSIVHTNHMIRFIPSMYSSTFFWPQQNISIWKGHTPIFMASTRRRNTNIIGIGAFRFQIGIRFYPLVNVFDECTMPRRMRWAVPVRGPLSDQKTQRPAGKDWSPRPGEAGCFGQRLWRM